jgi:hypothetical protein
MPCIGLHVFGLRHRVNFTVAVPLLTLGFGSSSHTSFVILVYMFRGVRPSRTKRGSVCLQPSLYYYCEVPQSYVHLLTMGASECTSVDLTGERGKLALI